MRTIHNVKCMVKKTVLQADFEKINFAAIVVQLVLPGCCGYLDMLANDSLTDWPIFNLA